MLPAEQGDALWIEYGSGDHPSRVLFDAGTPKTWPALRRRIEALPEDGRHFELLVVSHVDNDHIGGTLQLLRDQPLGVTFGDIWFNGYKHLPDLPLEPLGPVEGDELTAELTNRSWNRAFDGHAVAIRPDGTLPAVRLPGGMVLTILSPTLEQLQRLKPVWQREVHRHGLEPGVPPEPHADIPAGIEAFGPSEGLDVVKLANSPFLSDTSTANASSIAVLASYERRSVILSADAHPAVLIASIKRINEARMTPRLRVSALKVPHHGSRANVSRELLSHVAARDFLFSSSGSRTQHPHPESVARVIVEADSPRLLFNYSTCHTRPWDDLALQEKHGYTTVIAEGTDGLMVTLDPE